MTFTKYELQVLREAIIADRETWEEQIERGIDVSERFMKTLESLEDKLWNMIEEMK
jgi:hypothetical protein